jgi:GTPase
MLADRARINVRGGDGGNGCVSFRREAHVPRGGPNGGDGGRGGDLYLVASRQLRDLAGFVHKPHRRAGNGRHGEGSNRHGADGSDLRVAVPVGTEVRVADGTLLADLAREGDAVLAAAGGEGGRGNTCFVSSRRRAPRFAERGLPGEERWIQLDMKLLADVGFVGLPNAGKSSLLAALTRARPRIAAYPFTTIEPNLGTLLLGDRVVVLADIPGLVEGASRGVGLGHRFLAHIERTEALVYVVDASVGPQGAATAVATVRAELDAFQPALLERPAIVALNKTDLLQPADVEETVLALAPGEEPASIPVCPVSCVTGDGLEALVRALDHVFPEPTEHVVPPPPVVLRPGSERAATFIVVPEGDAWRIAGAALERLVAKADLDNDEAVVYLQHVMERAGVSAALRRAGAQPGATVLVGEAEFEFQ